MSNAHNLNHFMGKSGFSVRPGRKSRKFRENPIRTNTRDKTATTTPADPPSNHAIDTSL